MRTIYHLISLLLSAHGIPDQYSKNLYYVELMGQQIAATTASTPTNLSDSNTSAKGGGSLFIIVAVLLVILVLLVIAVILFRVYLKTIHSLHAQGQSGAVILAKDETGGSVGSLNNGNVNESIKQAVMADQNLLALPTPTEKSSSNNFTGTASTNNNSTIATTMLSQTAVEKGAVLSLPGYREMKFGDDFKYDSKRPKRRGGAGSVYVGQALTPDFLQHGKDVIVKVAHDQQPNQQTLGLFIQEVSMMEALKDGEYIAKLVGFCFSPYAIIMKLYSRGSLDSFLEKSPLQKDSDVVYVASDIAKGIGYMHSKGYAHCDIKPQNILVEILKGSSSSDKGAAFKCVLTDFGFSQVVSDKTVKVKHFTLIKVDALTTSYAAPEMFMRMNNEPVDVEGSHSPDVWARVMRAGDIFSLGIIIYELLCKKRAWRNKRLSSPKPPKDR